MPEAPQNASNTSDTGTGSSTYHARLANRGLAASQLLTSSAAALSPSVAIPMKFVQACALLSVIAYKKQLSASEKLLIVLQGVWALGQTAVGSYLLLADEDCSTENPTFLLCSFYAWSDLIYRGFLLAGWGMSECFRDENEAVQPLRLTEEKVKNSTRESRRASRGTVASEILAGNTALDLPAAMIANKFTQMLAAGSLFFHHKKMSRRDRFFHLFQATLASLQVVLASYLYINEDTCNTLASNKLCRYHLWFALLYRGTVLLSWFIAEFKREGGFPSSTTSQINSQVNPGATPVPTGSPDSSDLTRATPDGLVPAGRRLPKGYSGIFVPHTPTLASSNPRFERSDVNRSSMLEVVSDGPLPREVSGTDDIFTASASMVALDGSLMLESRKRR